MRKNIIFFLFVICFHVAHTQEFKQPAPGKSTVCFVNYYQYFKVHIFDNEECLTISNYLKYSIHEVDSGYHLFWVDIPQKGGQKMYGVADAGFYETRLEEGKLYLIKPFVKDVQAFSSTLGLLPYDSVLFVNDKPLKRLLKYTDPYVTPQKDIEKAYKKYGKVFNAELKKYNELKKMNDTIRIGTIEADQFFPIELLNGIK